MKKKQPRLRFTIAISALILIAALLFSSAAFAQTNEDININYSRYPNATAESSFIIDSKPSPSPKPMSTLDDTEIEYGNASSQRIIQKGINYLSQWHWYLPNVTTDEILRRDFAKFQTDGIKYISLPLYWYRLEGPIRGDFTGSNSYGDAFLANIKRVIGIANQYGIKTMVDIHTLWG